MYLHGMPGLFSEVSVIFNAVKITGILRIGLCHGRTCNVAALKLYSCFPSFSVVQVHEIVTDIVLFDSGADSPVLSPELHHVPFLLARVNPQQWLFPGPVRTRDKNGTEEEQR